MTNPIGTSWSRRGTISLRKICANMAKLKLALLVVGRIVLVIGLQ